MGFVSPWKSEVVIFSNYQAEIRPTVMPMVIAVAKSVGKLSNITMEKFDAVFEILVTLPAKIRDIIIMLLKWLFNKLSIL